MYQNSFAEGYAIGRDSNGGNNGNNGYANGYVAMIFGIALKNPLTYSG